jgi:ABC-type branched-subunit amino acid transport system substrate-binding protein
MAASACTSTARKTAGGADQTTDNQTSAATSAKAAAAKARLAAGAKGAPGAKSKSGGSGGSVQAGSASETRTIGGVKVGRGITAKTIKLGFFGANPQYASTVYQGLGAGGLDPGPQLGAAKAMIAWMNSHGGIAGRKVDPIYYEVKSGQSNEQQACATLAEDNKTFAVITNNAADQLPGCMKKNHTVLLQEDTGVHDIVDVKNLAPYYYAPAWFDQQRNAKVYVDGLQAQGYFKGAKIGLLLFDAPYYQRAADVVQQQLKHYGLKLTERFAYQGVNNPDGPGNAVVRFRASTVTHVMVLDFHTQMIVTFANAAEAQGYRPRYGLNSSSQWSVLRDEGSLWRPEQYRNAVGVGHRPVDDIDSRTHNSAVKLCMKIYTDAGLQLHGANAARYSLAYCDLLMFLKRGLERATELTPDGLWSAVGGFGSTFESALTFGTRFGPSGGIGGPTTIRYGAFDQGCTCFKYTGGSMLVKD